MAPATFTVTTVADAAAGSLRDAIAQANTTPGPDTIAFAIPGSSDDVHTIHLLSPLPAIAEALTIDGYSQPGARPNSNFEPIADNAHLLIALDGAGAGAGANGLILATGASTVTGLVIHRFAGSGIVIGAGAGGSKVAGCFIGTDATGTAALPNLGDGITIFGGAHNVIGGSGSPETNVISGNAGYGIALSAGAHHHLVNVNMIGTDATGTVAVGNQAGGILLTGAASDNTIGNDPTATFNIIAGNGGHGVTLSGEGTTRNKIGGNFIGTTPAGLSQLGNHGAGVAAFDHARGNAVGGTVFFEGNVIAFNSGAGVLVEATAGALAILGNAIHDNAGTGLDLGGDGFTPNDTADADTGANGLQNFPVITGAFATATGSLVTGTLDSQPGTTYRVEFFQARRIEGHGVAQGQTLRAFLEVTTDAAGHATFSTVIPEALLAEGEYVTTTATAQDTSEFSIAAQVVSAVVARVGDASVLEGTGGARKILFTVSLTQSAPHGATVQFTTADFSADARNATAGLDYQALTGSLTFAPGELSKTIEVNVTTDSASEPREMFKLLLTGATGARTDGAEAVGTIIDDDHTLIATSSATGSEVRVFDARTGALASTFSAFGPRAKAGVRLATGDVNGDGVDDIVVASGAGSSGGTRVRVFDGADPQHHLIREFTPFGSSFLGGL